MIKIKNITIKNFMSIGNVSQAVDFDKNPLTLVLGENLDQGGDDAGSRNGVGKSCILNALSYVLYGRALTKIKRNNLINNINEKNMLVTLNFEKDGIKYRIERGRSPNVLKLYIDDKIVEIDESQGDSRNTQTDIDNILVMSHDLFTHIIALNTYTDAFLSMRVHDQRTIIEQLLGITILSQKAEMLKTEIKTVKETIFEETAKINAIKESNKKIEETIKSTKLRQAAWLRKRDNDVDDLKDSISELTLLDIDGEIALHEEIEKWDNLYRKHQDFTTQSKNIIASLNKSQKLLEKVKNEINTLNTEETCFTCGQVIESSKREELLKEKTKEQQEIQDYNQELTDKLDNITKEIENDNIGDRPSKKPYYKTLHEAHNHLTNLRNYQASHMARTFEKDPYEEQIKQLEETAIQKVNWKVINELETYKDHQEFLLRLLINKDSFIRKKIIDQNLNYLNSRLTHYLNKTGLPHSVIFQNDLSVEITNMGKDLDFDNLSRGERNRLILSLSWAFRDVWESLYHGINLLFVDEMIDSGMDGAGVENCLGILKNMGRDAKKNIFLISHKDELIGRVNTVLKVTKENEFTTFANDLDIVD